MEQLEKKNNLKILIIGTYPVYRPTQKPLWTVLLVINQLDAQNFVLQ